MSYKLSKPCTELERLNFIVEYNHNKRLKLEETVDALYALEPNEMMSEGVPVLNPNYEQEQAEKERERIKKLKLTKRVFMLALQELGISYADLKTLIATNEQAQMEWDLCVELERGNPLLDVMAVQLNVTSEQLDYIFRKANGEDVEMPLPETEAVEE